MTATLFQHRFLCHGNLPSRKAFSLFELLLVMGVLAVLAGISFAAYSRSTERAREAQALAEIQRLGIALEQYRNHYGDFPVISPETEGAAIQLIETLLGERSPTGEPLEPADRRFLDLGDFTKENGNAREFAAQDPWGHDWVYVYDPSLSNWSSPQFILYSRGRSGEHEAPAATGAFEPQSPENRDNVFYE
ncbi:MAG: prepilin-type N-terminal cleavage/methylation domain-containing protein [Opitutales bacterium]|nr:prepilin-type N-terminal cleavage/methylation domain-containing protein [Opitutales bacterium]MCH8541024.1 prepilin-type N-terminal cleavage/methylation domain-containing protein [Opitutales bacterium]